MTKKPGGKWRRAMKLVTPLTFVCGLIAVVYFFYRAALITVPAVSFEKLLLHPGKSDAIVCGQEEGNHLTDPSPILSAKYQKRVASQPVSTNLVTNPAMIQVDSESGDPVGYSHNLDISTGKFQYLRDATDKQLFLRVINEQALNKDVALWQIDPVPIQKDRTYAYSFSYRSDVPVQVSIEYTKDGRSTYKDVMTVKANSKWQDFTAHFDNTDNASTFRVLLAGQAQGYVDTRNFNIHQIPDAKLSSGVVSVTFDDGWQSVKDKALPLLNRYHIRTTQYVISEVADREVPEYMDLGTVMQLKKAGHEIGSHSLLHCNQTELSKDLIQDNASRSKTILEKQGLGPIKSFAYPLGQYNETTQDIFSKSYPLIRTSDFGYNDRYFDETNVHSMGVIDKTSDSEFQLWLDYAKKHRQWLVIVYHRTNESGEYNVTDAQLDRQLNMISKSGIKVLPMSEAADFARK
jgi:peptidoglycan/xylan/chitin deacetylase (PgdA/CDA1 family)